jgi:hypothetical protein
VLDAIELRDQVERFLRYGRGLQRVEEVGSSTVFGVEPERLSMTRCSVGSSSLKGPKSGVSTLPDFDARKPLRTGA